MHIIFKLVSQSIHRFRKKEGIQIAAALSYFTLFATAPILIILMTSLNFFVSNELTQSSIVSQVSNIFGPSIGQIVSEVIENISTNIQYNLGNSLISFSILIITATTLIRHLQKSLYKMWDIEENRKTFFSKIMKRILALIFLFLVSLLILISFLFSILLTLVETYMKLDITSYYFFTTLFSFIVTIILFFLIYKYLTDVEMRSQDALPGALFTGILFMMGKNLIGIYLARTNYMTIYGAAGSLLGFLVWIYYSYLMFLFGAALTYTYASLKGHGIHQLNKSDSEFEKINSK